MLLNLWAVSVSVALVLYETNFTRNLSIKMSHSNARLVLNRKRNMKVHFNVVIGILTMCLACVKFCCTLFYVYNFEIYSQLNIMFVYIDIHVQTFYSINQIQFR